MIGAVEYQGRYIGVCISGRAFSIFRPVTRKIKKLGDEKLAERRLRLIRARKAGPLELGRATEIHAPER